MLHLRSNTAHEINRWVTTTSLFKIRNRSLVKVKDCTTAPTHIT